MLTCITSDERCTGWGQGFRKRELSLTVTENADAEKSQVGKNMFGPQGPPSSQVGAPGRAPDSSPPSRRGDLTKDTNGSSPPNLSTSQVRTFCGAQVPCMAELGRRPRKSRGAPRGGGSRRRRVT